MNATARRVRPNAIRAAVETAAAARYVHSGSAPDSSRTSSGRLTTRLVAAASRVATAAIVHQMRRAGISERSSAPIAIPARTDAPNARRNS
jgi:hypothetical protein